MIEMEESRIKFDRIYAYLRKSRSDGDTETVEEILAKHECMLQEYMMTVTIYQMPTMLENDSKSCH